MFAILVHESMNPFYQNIGSFPTVFFTFFLLLCVLYWLIAVLGLIDLDALNLNIDVPEADGIGEVIGSENAIAGLLLKIGLHGVPFIIILTLLSLIGWLLSYYSVHFLFPPIPSGLFRYLAGIPVLLGSLLIAMVITAQLIKPLRYIFNTEEQDEEKYILGQVAVVRSSRVDQTFGEAVLTAGGAGLILKVRATDNHVFKKGDRVVIFEKLQTENIYRVISEQEFIQ